MTPEQREQWRQASIERVCNSSASTHEPMTPEEPQALT
jgi:hypothetical protein